MAKKKAKKKTAKKAAKKKTSAKKATKKKATKKAAKKKTTKKAAKKKTKKKTARRSSSSSSAAFPDFGSGSDDLYSPPPADSYSASGMGSTPVDQGDEGSSRRVAILGIIVLAVVIVFVILFKGPLMKGDKGKMGKVDTALTKGKTDPKTKGKVMPKAKAGAVRTHKVQKGESLGRIARRYLGSSKRYPEITKLNGKTGDRWAKPGMTIKIPPK